MSDWNVLSTDNAIGSSRYIENARKRASNMIRVEEWRWGFLFPTTRHEMPGLRPPAGTSSCGKAIQTLPSSTVNRVIILDEFNIFLIEKNHR